MNLKTLPILLILALTGASIWSCQSRVVEASPAEQIKVLTANISTDKDWSERMALSIMKRAPEAWQNDFQDNPKWTYTIGLLLNSIGKIHDYNKEPLYFDYIRSYADTMIDEEGKIQGGYDIAAFNIDNIAPGALLLRLYQETKEERYLTAIQTLKRQLSWQPQTTDGGYWHKLRYPWQMWLDGLFMGEPFQAQYAQVFGVDSLYDHIADQFILAEKHTRDAETGLLYHAWDESRIQRWSNPETGRSQHFWSRAVGWYCMGLVDVLDFFPENHPKRSELEAILDRTLQAVLKVQDPETHTWWQVLDLPEREGNYLESTGSCMFTYAMIKGVNEGYLSADYYAKAKASYEGILTHFIKVDDNGEVHLTRCCAVAGLGGNPYRDGSFEYYMSEPIRDNDAKGLGPFINASLEFERYEREAKM